MACMYAQKRVSRRMFSTLNALLIVCVQRKFLLFFLLISLCRNAEAQIQHWSPSAELGSYIGTSSTAPFWLRSNQFGTVPLTMPSLTGRVGLTYESQIYADTIKKSKHSKIRWGAGAETVFNLGRGNEKVLLPEAYLKVRWKKLEFWGGRRKQILGIVDTTLSTGSFTWSGNAMPVPKIQLGFPDYVPLKFLKNYVSLKGFFSHGWFNVPYIQDAYLHQKTLHGKFGKPGGKFSMQIGVVHSVTWGGHADYLKTSPLAVNGQLTDNFGDFLWGVVIGKIPKAYQNRRFTNFDGENRVGNHVGQYDLAFEYQLKTSKLLLYHNHPFEDGSGLQLQNIPDGLYGLSWKRAASNKSFIQVRGVLLEYLFSKDQSGAGFDLTNSHFKGNDNYFDHAQYKEGWSYFGKGMGTPFIQPNSEIKSKYWGEFFPDNRVVVYHVGLEGTAARSIQWRTKLSYSSNFGTNNRPFNPTAKQFSYLLMVDAPIFKWGNTRLVTKLAFDQGDLLPSSLAGYVGFRATAFGKWK
ncbi:hypothetical protein IEE83_22355 [Dyadobacter sp. UP-52]|uniref:Capsule assembly protein Wzi n=2 Tax=Dyadobacter subterraneus TaxID=2773304 RepID=A0ABR9WGL4_9BACT|nr:hypothetical protein [Dyadobacter subterraneus]